MLPNTVRGMRFLGRIFPLMAGMLCGIVETMGVTGGRERLSHKRVLQERLDDVIYGPADVRNDLDTGDPEDRLEGAGDARADQDVDPKSAEPLYPVVVFEPNVFLPVHVFSFNLHHPHVLRDVEDGRDPANPNGECNSHRTGRKQQSCQLHCTERFCRSY